MANDHFILITIDDKRDPVATVYDNVDALDRALAEVQPGDPRYILIQGGRVVRFSRPPSKLVIEGDDVKPAKKERKKRADAGTKRSKPSQVVTVNLGEASS